MLLMLMLLTKLPLNERLNIDFCGPKLVQNTMSPLSLMAEKSNQTNTNTQTFKSFKRNTICFKVFVRPKE